MSNSFTELLDTLIQSNYDKIKQVLIINQAVLLHYNIIHQETILSQSADRRIQSIQSMASEHVVPEIEQDNYEDILAELQDIHAQIIRINSELDKVLLRSKQAEKRIHDLNKVEKLVRQYNRLM